MNSAPNQHANDQWVAAALAALLGLAFTFHLGASLTARISRQTFNATVSQSTQALIAMPSHFRSPGSAWTPQLHLSTLAFWLIEATLFLCLATIAGMTTLWWANRQSRDHLGVQSNAGIACSFQLRHLRVKIATVGRIVLGRSGRYLIATEPQTSLAVIGPTGCGKTAGFAIPALLEWSGPLIATSVKADLITTTIRHRTSRGKVWVYDPTQCSGNDVSAWSPLAACTTWAGAQQMASWMCEAAQPKLDTVSDGDYWYTQARKALAPYLYAASIQHKTMADVVVWIDNQDQDHVEAILRQTASVDNEIKRRQETPEFASRVKELESKLHPLVVQSMHEWFSVTGKQFSRYAELPIEAWPTVFQAQLAERLGREARAMAVEEIEATMQTQSGFRERMAPLTSVRSLWEKDQRLRDSVFATVENVVAPYAQLPAIDEPSDEIDIAEWLSGDNTIYVVASSHDQARLRPVLTTFVQQAVRGAFDTAIRNGGTLEHPCLVLLDEAGNIAPLRDLPAYASTARSHGIGLVTIWQDLAQLKALYRDRAQTVINNHRAKLFGTGIADDQTLEYVSRLIGDISTKEQNVSRDLGSGRRSLSEHTSYRRAAPMDVLRRIKVNEAVLVYGSDVPARIRLRPWFKDQELTRRAGGD